MVAFNARRAPRCVAPSVLALSVVYISTGSSRSSGGVAVGGAAAARPAAITHARVSTAASAGLPLKNLLLTDRDGLAPPAFVAGQRDVLTRHPGRRAFAVADREEHVLARGEVGGVRLPGRPLLAGCTASYRQKGATEQQPPQTNASHVRILRGKLVRPQCYADRPAGVNRFGRTRVPGRGAVAVVVN